MGQRILFFDGVCNLCNQFVDFVIKRDVNREILFAPLQGETAKKHLPPEFRGEDPPSVVFWQKGSILTRSDAALAVLEYLKSPWVHARLLAHLPKPLRDWTYDRVAKARYRLFGRRSTCRIPTPEERSRFLD